MSRIFNRAGFILPAVFIMIILVLIPSCKKNGENHDDSGNLSFDKSKLGIEIADKELGIKFYPPKNWDLRQTLISRKIETRGSAGPEEQFIYNPTYVFFNDSTGGLLSVGKVETRDTSLSKSARLNYYKGLINSKHKNDNLLTTTFDHSKLYFSKFRIEKENLISFKLIFENNEAGIIEFDYTIPADYLKGAEQLINASVASIRPQ